MMSEKRFKKYRKKPIIVEAYQTDEEKIIETLEGKMKANKGDYIIKGIKGELYPCKEDIFYETYDKVENDTQYNGIARLKEENEQLKIANAKWLDKSLQDRQIRYSNTNHKELTKKYLLLKEENEQLRKQCFELEKDYLIETSDISDKIYLDDEIKELKQKYGVKDE